MFFACVILLRFLRTFLTQSTAFRALRLDGNRALDTSTQLLSKNTKV